MGEVRMELEAHLSPIWGSNWPSALLGLWLAFVKSLIEALVPRMGARRELDRAWYTFDSEHQKILINLTFATPQVAVCLGIHPNDIPSHRGGRLLPKARHLLQVFFLSAAGWVGPCQKRMG